jgi:hypothetical protein
MEIFRDDVERLTALTGRDLSHWLRVEPSPGDPRHADGENSAP